VGWFLAVDVAARDLLGEGRAQLARGNWAAARGTLARALAYRDDPATCYELARAEEWAGDFAAAVRLYERAFTGFRARGEARVPALIAGRELSFLHAAVYGNVAEAGGWLARARSLVEEAGDCPEAGWVALAEALAAGSAAGMARHARSAERIAARFADQDLHFCALAYQGTARVLQGRVAEGMRAVDEAAVAALHGEVADHLVAGEIYCKMLLCCEAVVDVRRATQWTADADAFGQASHDLWVSGICRMHYGGILICAGRWADAEAELSASLRIHDAGMRALRGGAAVRLADLRFRQGRFEEAAVLLSDNEYDEAAVLPMARLSVVRGDRGAAVALLRRALDRPGSPVHRARLLALLADLLARGGEREQALVAVDRLAALADRTALAHVAALAEEARAGVAPEGDEAPRLRAAVLAYGEAGLPWEAAVARLRLARRLARVDAGAAVTEARSALAGFHALGSRPGADEAAQLLRSLGVRVGARAPRRPGLSARETDVLRLLATGRSNAEIAAELFVSKRTVEHHVGAIFAKLGVRTRAAAMARAVRDGWPPTS
jgi:DNA-binding CsgD family transcriptional regulator